MKNKDEFQFEKKLQRLEEIVDNLDAGEIPLEEMLHQFEEGMEIAGQCRTFLESAEQKVIQISQKNTSSKKVAETDTAEE